VFDPDQVGTGRLAKLAQIWRLPDGRPTIVLPARVTRWKGGTILIEALARMQRTDAVAILVGSDQGRSSFSEQLVRQAERLGVADRVRLVGHCDDMPAALLLADVVVSASTQPEAFGRAVIEAQAMGRMVIATDHGGAAETVMHGTTGWRVPPGDAAALARATGDWVAFIDADDLWLPGHVTQAQAVLAAIPSAEWIVAAHEVLGPDGARTRPPALSDAHPVAPVAPGVLRYAAPASTQALIGNYWLHLGGCIVRTSVARRTGGFAERCLYSEDWLFFLCLSTLADLYFLPAPGYVLRRQHASLTTSSRRLTQHRVSGKRAALAHPALTPHRQQLRWALRSTYKGLAANNVLARHHARGAWFALRAFAMDPREVHEAVRFLRLLLARDRTRAQALAPAYSAAELLPGA